MKLRGLHKTTMPKGYAIFDQAKWSDFQKIDFDLKVCDVVSNNTRTLRTMT